MEDNTAVTPTTPADTVDATDDNDDEKPRHEVDRPRSAKSTNSLHSRQEQMSPARHLISSIVRSEAFDAIMVSVIILNMLFIVIEVDIAVNEEIPIWLKVVGYVFLAVYLIEIAARLYVERLQYFYQLLNVMDCCIVVWDGCFQILMEMEDMPAVSVLRILRVVRLVRVIRAFSSFRELWLMLHGIAAAMKAMIWACVLIAVVLVIWSIVSVEVINRLHKQSPSLIAKYEDNECGRCEKAFSSIPQAILTWFIMVFAGDLWNDLAVPLMEEYPWTGIIFLSAFVSVNLGMLNLILTVIVDRASEARADDEQQKVLDKKNEFERAKHRLLKLCEAMDSDESGELTLEEIEEGFEVNPEFAAVLQVMDVERDDLKTVFGILDEDKSGAVTYSEFVDQIHKMKSQESHTLLIFIKHYITDVRVKVSEQLELFKTEFLQKSEQQDAEIQNLMRLQGLLEEEAPLTPLTQKPKLDRGDSKISSASSSLKDTTKAQQFLSVRKTFAQMLQASTDSPYVSEGGQHTAAVPATSAAPFEKFCQHIDERLNSILQDAKLRAKEQAAARKNDMELLSTLTKSLSELVGSAPDVVADSNGKAPQRIGAVVVPVVMNDSGEGGSKGVDELVMPVQVIRPSPSGLLRSSGGSSVKYMI